MLKIDFFDQESSAQYEAQLKSGETLVFKSVPGGPQLVRQWLDTALLSEDYCFGVCKGKGMQGAVLVVKRGSKVPNLEYQEWQPKLQNMTSKLAPPPGPPKRYGDRQ